MIILGINEEYCATAALMKDGEVLAVMQKECLSRKKKVLSSG